MVALTPAQDTMENGFVASLVPAPHAGAEIVATPAPELTIVVPNPSGVDVRALIEDLQHGLAGHDWEIVFVNARAGTLDILTALAEADRRVRILRPVGRGGLAAAALAGMLTSHAQHIAVIDGDEDRATALAAMLARLGAGDVDLVVMNESESETPSPIRHWSAKFLRHFLHTPISDPMSRMLMIRQAAFARFAPNLSAQGFRILIDLLFSARGRLRVAEIQRPGIGASRGTSNVDLLFELAGLTIAKLTYDAISIRFLMFCTVGLSGVGFHMAVLESGLALIGLPFTAAQTLATIGAMIWNFTFNNVFTYHDQQLRGSAFFTGLIRFMIICAVGALSNVGVASWIYGRGSEWWLAGLGGIVVGAVWNYAVTAVFVWRQR
jgi:dolichol-phosphate mannosyltransferase